MIQTAWKASGKVRDRAIPKADSMRLWLKSSCAKSSLVVAISTVPGTYLYPFYNHFQQQVTPSPGCFFAAALYTEWSTTRLRSVGWGCSIATSQQNCDNQNRTMTSVKTVHHLIGEDYWKLVWWDGLAKKKFQSPRVYQASLIPSRPEAIYIIYFRVTAWLSNLSSVRGMYSFLWEQQQKKRHLINRSTKMQCLNRRLRFIRALQPTYPARQSESNYDFCENCSSLDKWSLLKIGLVRWSCQKRFQRVSGYIKPVWSKQTGGHLYHLFSSNGMTR